MSTPTPIYISILILLISAVLVYIITEWMQNIKWSDLFGSLQEGFSNPQYTYKPNRSYPNLSITFGLSDLAIDISSACGFVKIDSELVSTTNSTTSPSSLFGSTALSTKPSVTSEPTYSSYTNPSPPSYSASSDTSSSITSYTPPSVTSSILSNSIDLSTVMKSFESNSIASSVAIESMSSMSMTTNGDYTVPYTNLQIYTMYNNSTGYSSTGNTNIYSKMDASYAYLFDSSQLSSMTDANIAQLWNSNTSVLIDDALFNASKFFIIQPPGGKCDSGLSAYFLQLVQKNKSNASVLLSLKNAYYAVIKQRFLMNTLSNIYWQNAKALTNSDKGTYNSILFVLNTGSFLANTNTLETDLSANNVAQIVKSDTPFTMDSLWLYQMASVTYELVRFGLYFEKNGENTSGKGTPAITTKYGSFISGYQQYLQKINQIAPKSPLLFMFQHIPNGSDCESVNILSKHISTILS